LVEPLGAEPVHRALEEDAARADVTTALLGESALRIAEGGFVAEETMVVAGTSVVRETFRQLDETAEFVDLVADGSRAAAGATIATVRGSVQTILAGERVALNFLQRLSGIATQTRMAVDAVAGTGAEITHTRKTTPGLRELECYAVRLGGGVAHRVSLADAVLWKDNHWLAAARLRVPLRDALAEVPEGTPVMVEVESIDQLEQALKAGVRRVLVDNQPAERVRAWVARCGPDVAVEASGGLTLATLRDYARAGARYLSIGMLTHSAPAARIRLDLSIPTSA